MNEPLPAPLVAADVDLNGYQFMPLYGHRLFGSEFNARCSDAAWRAGVTLWWAAWNQVPAASLPDDDAALCRLADLGRDVKAWRKIRADALHGFVKCSDGRLYHRALAEYAAEAWDRRVRDRARKAAWRAGRNADADRDETRTETGTHVGQRRDVPADRDRDRDRERDRERDRDKVRDTGDPPSLPVVAAQTPPKQGELIAGETKSGRGSRLPDAWPLTDELRAIASETRAEANLPPINVDLEHSKFLDYWHAKAGQDGRKASWLATWRNWCRNARTGHPGRSGAFGEGMRSQIAEAASLIDQQRHEEAPAWPALPTT